MNNTLLSPVIIALAGHNRHMACENDGPATSTVDDPATVSGVATDLADTQAAGLRTEFYDITHLCRENDKGTAPASSTDLIPQPSIGEHHLFSEVLQTSPVTPELGVLVCKKNEQVFLFLLTLAHLVQHLFPIDFSFRFLHLQILQDTMAL